MLTDPVPGDVVRAVRRGRSTLIEVEGAEGGTVWGRVPYASTYEPGGRYEGSYRGASARWLDEVVEIVRPHPALDTEPGGSGA